MVAFEIFGRPIYRYGLFYLITFVIGYIFLRWVGRQSFLDSYPKLQSALHDKRDDLMIVVLLGVILGGRLGHVLFYEPVYYFQHPLEILYLWEGGMAFVGGVLGVTVGFLYRKYRQQLSRREFILLGDIILCIVPVGSLLGRVGNSLNQELRGKQVADVSGRWASVFEYVGLVRVYSLVDQTARVDTNMIQIFLEGGLLLLLVRNLLALYYLPSQRIRPGLIAGSYLIGYGVVRFYVEFFKDLPVQELYGPLSISQWLMILFVVVGVCILGSRTKKATI